MQFTLQFSYCNQQLKQQLRNLCQQAILINNTPEGIHSAFYISEHDLCVKIMERF